MTTVGLWNIIQFWSLSSYWHSRDVNPLKPSGNYMYRCFNNYQICIFFKYASCIIVSVKRDYLLKQQQTTGVCNEEELCSLCGMELILRYY
jgi:hypothetical protein